MTALLLMLLVALCTHAEARPVEDAQKAELDRVRREIADEVHLYAFDLIDEMVVQWRERPVFDKPTKVVLAGVTVPVGLGTGMQALVENHLSAVLLENPSTQVSLVHCPACTSVVVHSGPEATVVSRGVDNPSALADLGSQSGQHALFVDIEAEGAFLVLRARLTRLTEDLPIVWSRTFSTSTNTAALLRESSDLTTAAEAREQYLRTLKGWGAIDIPARLALRTYAAPYFFDEDGLPTTPPPPLLWLQTGVELGATDARAWTASVIVGYTFVPQAYQGIMAQARVNRLLTGRARSLTRPDLYLFAGGAVISVWGPSATSFQTDPVNADTILALAGQEGPRAAFGTFQLGLDIRVGNRIGLSGFLETLPSLASSGNLGEYLVFILPWQSLGTEVTFWF